MSATQIGQTAGTIAGAAILPGIGAPIGTLVGTLAGLVLDQQMDKGRERKETAELSKQLGAPRSTGAQAEALLGPPARVWVDERFENGRLIDGHFDWQPVS